MYQKQRINLASEVAAQGMWSLYCQVADPLVRELFQKAETQAWAPEIVQAKLSELPAPPPLIFLQYYHFVQKQQVDHARMEELFSSLPIPTQHQLLVSKQEGLASLLDTLRHLPGSATDPILGELQHLLAEQYRMLDQYSNPLIDWAQRTPALQEVVSLAPEAPDDGHLWELMDRENWEELGKALLQRLAPTDGGVLFGISSDLKPLFFRALQKHILLQIHQDKSLTEQARSEILSGHKHFIAYIGQQLAPQYPAFMALALEAFQEDFHNDVKYLSTLIDLGHHFQRLPDKETLNYEALIRLYEFILDRIDWIYQHPVNPLKPEETILTEMQLCLELGALYERFWEVPAAVQKYKAAAQLAYVNDMWPSLEELIFRIIFCYQDFFQDEKMLESIQYALSGKGFWLGINGGYPVSEGFRERLDAILVDSLQRLQVHPPRLKEVWKAMKSRTDTPAQFRTLPLFSGVWSMKKEDGTLELLAAQDPLLLPLQRLNDPFLPMETAPELVEKLEPWEWKLQGGDRLLLALHRTYLQVLSGEQQVLGTFHQLIKKMDRWVQFGPMEQAHWCNRYIEAMSRALAERPMMLIVLKETALRAVQKLTEAFMLSDLPPYVEHPKVQQLLGETIQAVLKNAKATSHRFATYQSVMAVLWNLLVYQQRFSMPFNSRGLVAAPDQDRHAALHQTLLDQLNDFLHTPTPTLKEKISTTIQAMHALEMPFLEEVLQLNAFEEPPTNALLIARQPSNDWILQCYQPYARQEQSTVRCTYLGESEKKELQRLVRSYLAEVLPETSDRPGDKILYWYLEDLLVPDFPIDHTFWGAFLEWQSALILDRPKYLASLDLQRGIVLLADSTIQPKRDNRWLSNFAATEEVPFLLLQDEQATAAQLQEILHQHPAIVQFSLPFSFSEDLPAELVVLRAPTQAFGTHYFSAIHWHGVELVVLSNASWPASKALIYSFLKGGAKAVLAPLYPVDKKSCQVFLQHFYDQLPEYTPLEALRRTQQFFYQHFTQMPASDYQAWRIWL